MAVSTLEKVPRIADFALHDDHQPTFTQTTS